MECASKMCNIRKILILLLTFSIKNLCWCMDTRGPRIIENLEDQVDFSNDTGVTINCRTQGNPMPSVSWVRADGSLVSNVPGLRQIFPNGSLHFMPFNAKDYRQDIHASVYKCMAVSPLGTVISNDVRVRAAVKQFYEIQVYDQYAIQGNTATLECNIPPFIQEFVRFTSWEREKHKMSETIMENVRYSIYPDGVLHIRDVHRDGSGFRYRCRTQHRLTGEYKRSTSAGKVTVTEEQIDDDSFLLLDQDTIKQLIPAEGPRLKFINHYSKFVVKDPTVQVTELVPVITFPGHEHTAPVLSYHTTQASDNTGSSTSIINSEFSPDICF